MTLRTTPEAALGASTSAVGVLTGGFSREALMEAGCFAVAKQLQELPSVSGKLASWPRGGSRMNQGAETYAEARIYPGRATSSRDSR